MLGVEIRSYGNSNALSCSLSVRSGELGLVNRRPRRMTARIFRSMAAPMVMWEVIVRYVAVVVMIGHASVGRTIKRLEVGAFRVCLGHHSSSDHDTISADTSEIVATSKAWRPRR